MKVKIKDLFFTMILLDQMTKGQVILWVGAFQGKSPSYQAWWQQTLWLWRHDNISLSNKL